jgi:hypothetical protein
MEGSLHPSGKKCPFPAIRRKSKGGAYDQDICRRHHVRSARYRRVCANTKPPTAAEIAIMQAAQKPSSQEAAGQAVKDYFADSLFDAEAARYQFPLPPAQGSFLTPKGREFGWFMCGKINGKNRMDGYTGYKTFYPYPARAGSLNVLVADLARR